MKTIDTDMAGYGRLLCSETSAPGVIPRRDELVYGGDEAMRLRLEPVEDAADELVTKSELRDVIEHCHEEQIFPMYWENYSWRRPGFKWNQNGLGFCWTWSGTGGLQSLRACEDKDHVDLAPNSMGWLVDWKDRGNYLESWIKGAREKGVAPADMCGGVNSHDINPRNFDPAWETERAKYRLDRVWDTDNRARAETRLLHIATILRTGRPCYAAWYNLAHAMSVVGINWTPGEYLDVTLVVSNSHNQVGYRMMKGSKAIPNETFGLMSSVPA